MGFTKIGTIYKILLLCGVLQCHQAKKELPDLGSEGFDETYQELNENSGKNEDFSVRPIAKDNEDAINIAVGIKEDSKLEDDQEEVAEIHEQAEKRRRFGQRRRANGEKRRMFKQERMRGRHQHRLNFPNKGSEMLNENAEDESSDRDDELANFYLTKASDIANMSAILGPGPIPIQLVEPTTKKPTTQTPASQTSAGSTVSSKTTKFSIDDVKKVANISEVNDFVSLVGEHNRGSSRRFKSHKIDDEDRNDELETVILPREKVRKIRKHKSMLRNDDREHFKPRTGHKKRKHKGHSAAINTNKGIEKYRLNDDEQYTNLSVINKSFQSAIGKKFGLKNPESDSADGDENEEIGELARIVVDKMSEEDAKRLCFLQIERENGENDGTLKRLQREGHNKSDNKIGNLNGHRSPQKGIKSKIEHGDWVDKVTLFPIRDYTVRKNKAHDKKNPLSPFLSPKKYLKELLAGEKKHSGDKKLNVKISDNIPNENAISSTITSAQVLSLSDPSKEKKTYVMDSNGALEDVEKTVIKRSERDAEPRLGKHKSELSKGKSIFGRHKDTNDQREDEMYDVDTKNDEQGYSSFKKGDKNRYGNHGTLDKEEYSDDYDSNLSKNERSFTAVSVCPENTTSWATRATSVCAETAELVFTTKSTRRPIKPESTIKPSENPDIVANNLDSFDQRNKTNDPYEQFLNGQLADSYVAEVLRKVKLSRKISRELGYMNETDETCDRCIELKPIKVPDREVMRNALGKCSKNLPHGKDFATCCRVPPPMETFLDVLVSYEKENENNFYTKIQDDSSFIFTGDYSDTLVKGRNKLKIKDKYAEESSLIKATFEHQRLNDDSSEEKYEGSRPEVELNEEKHSSESKGGKVKDASKEMELGIKKYTRRYSKNKKEKSDDESFSDLGEKIIDDDLTADVKPNESDQFHGKNSPEGLSNANHNRVFGKLSWKNVDKTRKEYPLRSGRPMAEPDKKPLRTPFDRFHGKSNHAHYKQYESKSLPVKPQGSFSSNYDSLNNGLSKVDRDSDSLYQHPNSNGIKEDSMNLKNNYFGYELKNHGRYRSSNDKYKGYQANYGALYGREYPLYPDLEGHLEEGVRMAGNYQADKDEISRMVKRYAEDMPVYDDEPNVFFEIPDIEYDLY